jgi:hypothetical protein
MPGKAFVMAFVWSGWLIASVIAFMIVAYASFFGVGVIGLMIWFVTARVDMEQDGVVGAGVSPGFLAQQVRTRSEMSAAERAAHRGRQLHRRGLRRLPAFPDLERFPIWWNRLRFHQIGKARAEDRSFNGHIPSG